jgi:hypothetical protein
MLSSVVSALGVGFLGLEFSKGFPVTVTLAHVAFGTVLGWLSARGLGFQCAMWLKPALPETTSTSEIPHNKRFEINACNRCLCRESFGLELAHDLAKVRDGRRRGNNGTVAHPADPCGGTGMLS